MSEEQNQPRGGVRRVGRKDQKKRLSTPDSLFPLEDFVDADELATEANTLSLAQEGEAEETQPHETEEEALEAQPSAAEARSVMDFAPLTPEDERYAPPIISTPSEERFPPIEPNIKEPPAPQALKEKPRRRFGRQDAIAALFVLATLGLCSYFTFIWFNPYSALNPLAPPTPLPRVITATPPTSAGVEPTADAGVTATFTPFLSLVVTEEPTESLYPFVVVDGGVLYMPNANGSGCNWSSIAGTVIDVGGQPLNAYRVRVTSPEDASLDESVFSGSTLTFGAGGFELPLGGAPQEGQYRVRLFDPAGAPVSDEVEVVTRAECEANVALVNFVQVR